MTELLHWSIEYRRRKNGRWRSVDSRHHLDVAACMAAYKVMLWEEPPTHVRFRNTKTGEVVVPFRRARAKS